MCGQGGTGFLDCQSAAAQDTQDCPGCPCPRWVGGAQRVLLPTEGGSRRVPLTQRVLPLQHTGLAQRVSLPMERDHRECPCPGGGGGAQRVLLPYDKGLIRVLLPMEGATQRVLPPQHTDCQKCPIHGGGNRKCSHLGHRIAQTGPAHGGGA